jgi:hypothetical protein
MAQVEKNIKNNTERKPFLELLQRQREDMPKYGTT